MLKTPIVNVIGYKNSGKTSIIEKIVKRIVQLGYRVCVFKHVHDPDFHIDMPGKDSWRATEAGAEKVVLVSDEKRAVVEKIRFKEEDLDKLLSLGEDYDLVILEGFKSFKPIAADVYFVLAARNDNDVLELKKGRKNILFVNSPVPVKVRNTKNIPSGNLLTDDTDATSFVDTTLVPLVKTGKIWKELPDLDCGECGYSSCRDMASNIASQEDQSVKCPVKSTPSKLTIRIRESRVVMKRFVQEIIRSSVLAMVSTLKGAEITGNEDLTITIHGPDEKKTQKAQVKPPE